MGLTYTQNPASYTVGVAITPNRPSLASGLAQRYSAATSLPDGLQLEAQTGVISGTPTSLTPRRDVVITATGAGGVAMVTLTLTVNPAPPVIVTAPASQTVSVGAAVTFQVEATGTGTLTYQWQRGGVDLPGAVGSSYRIPSVSREDAGATFRVVVADGYGGRSTSAPATLGVLPGGVESLATLDAARYGHGAVRLKDGRILVVGGMGVGGPVLLAELVDPVLGTRSLTPGQPIHHRFGGTATLLADGRVLVSGGWNASGFVAMAELFDPHTGLFSEAGSLKRPRAHHTATLLGDGTVLLAGGLGILPVLEAELFEPSLRAFRSTLGRPVSTRLFHTATLLPDGRVALVGGRSTGGAGAGALASVEAYDPRTETFSLLAQLPEDRYLHQATLLPSGSLLVTGGLGASGTRASACLIQGSVVTPTGNLQAGRQLHTATLLSDGRVLIGGGWDGTDPVATFELYDPGAGTFQLVGGSPAGLHSHAAVPLEGGSVLLIGGYHTQPLSTVSRWRP